jgi:hypothetical protein
MVRRFLLLCTVFVDSILVVSASGIRLSDVGAASFTVITNRVFKADITS